jgi:hypothetical protein
MKIGILIAASVTFAASAPYLSLQEHHSAAGGRMFAEGKGIVDINAQVRISIDTAQIRKAARPLSINAEQVRTVTDLLRRQGAMFALLCDNSGDLQTRSSRLAEVSRYYDELLSFAMTIPELRATINSIYEQEATSDQYRQLGVVIGRYIDDVGAGLGKEAERNRIRLRLGGWLQEKSGTLRPVHIEGFDSYAAAGFYEAPFFIMPTADELRRQLIETKKVCDGNVITINDALRTIVNRADTLCTRTGAMLACVGDNMTGLAARTGAPTLHLVATTRSRSGYLYQRIAALVTAFKEVAQQPLANGPAVVIEAMQTFTIARDTLAAIMADVNQLAASRPGAAALSDSLRSAVVACTSGVGMYIAELESWRNTADAWLMLNGNGRMREITVAFGDEVERILLEKAPGYIDIDLRTLGVRSPGDRLVLRLACTQEKELAGDTTALVSEQRSITIARVNWYGRLTIGPAFVAPLDRDNPEVKLRKDFQPAVSYSLLLKKGSRTIAEPYASFLLPGVGVNVTAPDFNLDGVPEFGVGPVVSWANDILQCGAGRNIGADAWYGFFVLRLPFSLISAPGSEISVRE